MKHLLPALLVAAGVATGLAGLVYGEADDSPGLQLLGALLVLGTVVLGVRAIRRARRQHRGGRVVSAGRTGPAP